MSKFFSRTYDEARQKFLSLSRDREAALTSIVHPSARGSEGEELAMDFAMFGDPRAEKTLLLVSGTHGQEGFAGSAIQIAFLTDQEIPDGVNILALHGLNPWGFSHLSRTDENNVDVNRNFLDFSKPLPRNEFYLEMHPRMCPGTWNSDTIKLDTLLDSLVEQYGWQNVLNGISAGQYEEPTGLNFGGIAPSWSCKTVEEHLPPLVAAARKVAFIDWHTGLGAFGELCHVCLHDPDSPKFERWFEWMGDVARESLDKSLASGGKTPSYAGPFINWLPAAAPSAQWIGAAIEVGTYDVKTVGDALRMDRWLKFGLPSDQAHRDQIRQSMMDLLSPSSDGWQRAAVTNGCEAQAQALRGLANW